MDDFVAVQSDSWTPLWAASGNGHVECVRLLLDRGAGVDVADVSSLVVVCLRRVRLGLVR